MIHKLGVELDKELQSSSWAGKNLALIALIPRSVVGGKVKGAMALSSQGSKAQVLIGHCIGKEQRKVEEDECLAASRIRFELFPSASVWPSDRGRLSKRPGRERPEAARRREHSGLRGACQLLLQLRQPIPVRRQGLQGFRFHRSFGFDVRTKLPPPPPSGPRGA